MKQEPKWWQWLFDPFEFLGEKQGLIIGLAALILTGFLGFQGKVTFDGVLDFHLIIPFNLPFWFSLAQLFVNWLCLAVIAFLIGKIFSPSKLRGLDFFYTMAFARWPMFLIPLIFMIPGYEEGMIAALADLGVKLKDASTEPATFSQIVIFYAVILLSLLPYIWSIALLFKGFKISSNLKGNKLLFSFLGLLLVAEIISKLALSSIQTLID